MPQLDSLPTPALVVDLDALERNLDRMQAKCDALGVRLRPHVKTHKCVEIGRLQAARGARGITVATLEEAAAFADAGFDDLTWAFPLIPGRLAEARAISERSRLAVLVDSAAAVDALEAEGGPWNVWLKVDCGYGRAGVDPRAPAAAALAARIDGSATLAFDGILTHSGQSYAATSVEDLRAVAALERDVMVGFADRLRNEGVAVPAVSVGSTPAMRGAVDLAGVDEARPGNYAYHDLTMVALGVCAVADCALTVLSTVVSASADHAILDAGALALSKDAGVPAVGRVYGPTMGGILDGAGALREDVRLVALSQEHGKTDAPLPVGETVRVVPLHSCLAAACFDRVHAVRGDEVVDAWRVRRER